MVFLYKIQIWSYGDQGVDAKSISLKSEFTWIYFVKFLGSHLKFLWKTNSMKINIFEKFGFTSNHLDRGVFYKINI